MSLTAWAHARLPLLAHLVHHVLHGVTDQFRTACEVQLFLDALAMGLYGFHRQAQFFGDLAWADAVTDHLEDLELPIRKTLDRRAAHVLRAGDQAIDHAAGHALG